MIITKRILITIDLSGQAIYSPNRDEIILKLANMKLAKKCYNGSYIISVDKIIKKSDVKIADNKLDGNAQVDVQLEVKAIVFACGKEILFGQSIEKIEKNGVIILKGPLAAGMIAITNREREISKLLSEKQEIPVLVQKAMYAPNSEHITIFGFPFVPEIPSNVYYKINEDLSSAPTDNLLELMKKIEEEEKQHMQLDQTKYAFFQNLMYPFKTQQKFELSPLGSKFAAVPKENNWLKPFLTMTNGYIVAPIEETGGKTAKDSGSKNSELKIYFSREKKIEGVFVIESLMYSALFEILNNRLIYLCNLRGFVEHYKDKKFEQLEPYWKEINRMKL